jgi:glycosyltransferase involved in cell wall biosynthesis
MKLSVIFPTRNEGKTIAQCVVNRAACKASGK